MSINVISLDPIDIKAKLRSETPNYELNKQALQLIKALEEVNEKWKELSGKQIRKIKELSDTNNKVY